MRQTLNLSLILLVLVLDTNLAFGQQIDKKQVDIAKIFLNYIMKGETEKCWTLFNHENEPKVTKEQFENGMHQLKVELSTFDTVKFTTCELKDKEDSEFIQYNFKPISKTTNYIAEFSINVMFDKSSLLISIVKLNYERKTNSHKTDMTSYFHKKDSIFQVNLGKQYPAFKATSLNGQTIGEKGLIGKVTIINFWFKYCEPCVAEMDELCILQQKFIENPAFQFISFTSDSSEEAKEYVEKLKLSFPVYPISRNECYRLNFEQGFPTTIIVDKTGKIIFLKSGGSLEKEKIAQDIRKLEQIIEKELNAK